ncbi:hypothetical protein D9C73_016760 [Collichthys lucidus]|uniref:Uncharacterized protein n=1 Tax=Collichthys lucidus TaxID=240159 RepID=A0A4U5V5T3_COLLU|nr:hypothetical protein D9C73_016760 [Collichthys lucidus]
MWPSSHLTISVPCLPLPGPPSPHGTGDELRRNPQCVSAVGAPIVRGPAAEEKGPLVVNNSAVHSDHNGGTSHCFEHLFRCKAQPPLGAYRPCRHNHRNATIGSQKLALIYTEPRDGLRLSVHQSGSVSCLDRNRGGPGPKLSTQTGRT